MSSTPPRLMSLRLLLPRWKKFRRKLQRENIRIVSIREIFPRLGAIIAIRKAIILSITLSRKTNSNFNYLHKPYNMFPISNIRFSSRAVPLDKQTLVVLTVWP